MSVKSAFTYENITGFSVDLQNSTKNFVKIRCRQRLF